MSPHVQVNTDDGPGVFTKFGVAVFDLGGEPGEGVVSFHADAASNVSGVVTTFAAEPDCSALFVAAGADLDPNGELHALQPVTGAFDDVSDNLPAAFSVGGLLRFGDLNAVELVGELAIRSEPFRHIWAKADVMEKRMGALQLVHALVGAMTFQYHLLSVPARPDRYLITYQAETGSPTADALAVLLSWVADQPKKAPSAL